MLNESSAGTKGSLFGESLEEAKEEVIKEATIGDVVDDFAKKVRFAKRTNNVSLMSKLIAFGKKLLASILEFAKKAVEIAVYKFVLELCAMIIRSVMDLVTSKGNQRLDITTPGVHYNTATTTATGAPSSASPFESPYYQRATASIPW